MKPSGKRDQNCQTNNMKKPQQAYINERLTIPPYIIKKQKSCILSPVISLIEMREKNDVDDLKRVYNVLSAIEGRVRRLKYNLRM